MEEQPKTLRELAEEYFLKMYEYAKIYYEHYGSLDIDTKFNTDDGFTYKPDGKIRLGRWVHNQVKRAVPGTPHGEMLAQIGMIWDFNNNKKTVYDLCRMYQIDTEINYSLVNHIAAQEFQAKIDYLNKHNIPLMNNNRELHEMFYMDDKLMMEKYGTNTALIYQEFVNGDNEVLAYRKRY